MVRTQIQLTELQVAGLRELAGREGVSIAAVIRDAVDRKLEQEDRSALWGRAFEVVGKYTDPEGAAGVAEDHDRYLDDAYFHWRRS